MAGKFEIIKDKSGEYRFHLKAGNGEIIAASQGYKTKASALDGVESVQKNAADAGVVDMTVGTEGSGACNLCSCKGDNPSRAYGACEAKRENGSTVCGHYNTSHKAS